MKLIIGGDFVPTKSNESMFSNGEKESLFGDELIDYLQDADYRIFNLETPLTSKESPIIKNGPALIANPSTICGYKSINVDLLTLANNHILDQGIDGLRDTVHCLQTNDIQYVGVGETINEANRCYYFHKGDEIVGLYACCELEFSMATLNTPGANPVDDLYIGEYLSNAKKNCDYLIVLYHGGKEYYRYPSPFLQKRCRRYCEYGADLVVCQHSHCIGCEENYQNSKIIYGQGNFLFDNGDNEFWNSGLLVSVDTADRAIKYLPISKENNCVRVAKKETGESIINSFIERSRKVNDVEFINDQYKQLAKEKLNSYFIGLSSIDCSILAKIVNRLTAGRYYQYKLKKVYKIDKVVKVLNTVECEVHREMITTAMREMIENEEKKRYED